MKKILTLLAAVIFLAQGIAAQVAPPPAFSYKAVVRKHTGAVASHCPVSIRIAILAGSSDGEAVFNESFRCVTSFAGQADLIIGLNGDKKLSDIDWGASEYFIRTEADPAGGSNYSIISVTQLLSVPYSLYSGEASNGFSAAYSGNENRPYLDAAGNVSLGKPGEAASRLNVDGNINFTGKLLKNGKPVEPEIYLSAGENISLSGKGTQADPYVISASGQSAVSHYIGELFGGGIVFYVDHTGQHGLIASLQNFSSIWSNVSDGVGASDNGSWNGTFNTAAIASQPGHSSGAAKYCLDYTYNGFDDWFLPAVDQLRLLYNAKYVINSILVSDNDPLTEMLLQSAYWSSSEFVVSFMAYAVNMQDGTSTCFEKTTNSGVRPVRSF